MRRVVHRSAPIGPRIERGDWRGIARRASHQRGGAGLRDIVGRLAEAGHR